MRFTFNWLKEYLLTDLTVKEIADKLTSIGLEVDSIKNYDEVLANFKIVKIETVKQHPNAEKLKVCTVVDSEGISRQIVCGASNARAGLKTILAVPGAIIPASNAVIKKSKLRGIESEGMLCSKEELGMPSNEDGIIEINDSVELSASVGNVLGCDGGIFDVSITPNRGDCFCVKGIARDLAVAGAGKFLPPKDVICKSTYDFPIKINYEQSEAYRRYAPIIAFRVIKNIKNTPSPDWLKKKIISANMNSISSIVDLSNLWLMDSGRPLHIYDLNKIEGELSIRFANFQEKFTDIKGNEHILRQDMLIAADKHDPLCLLGIMGSAKAACTEDTTDILIESGLFDPIFISSSGAFLNITSDSRVRFERGIDKNSCIQGLEGITKAILEVCGGEASSILVIGDDAKTEEIVKLRKSKLWSIAGSNIDWITAKEILHSLGLKEIKNTHDIEDDCSEFLIPSWRSDLKIEEDLIEEIIRIIGYDNVIGEKINSSVIVNDKMLSTEKRILAIKRLMASSGLSEIISYSFIKQEYAEEFKNNKKLLHLLNPISEDLNVMRPSLVPSLILSAGRSLSYGSSDVKLFEVGNVFYDDCKQVKHIAALRAGNMSDRSWLETLRKADVFDIKADMFAIFDYYGLSGRNITITAQAPLYYHPTRSGTVYHGKNILGYFGELHPKINKMFFINEKMVCFELILDGINAIKKNSHFNAKIFPKINRDFAFVFDIKANVGNLIEEIYKLDSKIEKVDIFDSFPISVDDIENHSTSDAYLDLRQSTATHYGKKSIGITIALGAVDRTLTETEAQEISDKIIRFIGEKGGELRQK